MDEIRKLMVKHLWWLVLLVSVGMLVCHGLGVKRIVVDNTSLILLAIVLVSPFVAAIKKVKIGEFEAEIQPEEVSRVTREAERSIPVQAQDDARHVERKAITTIKNLLDADPIVALAKLRIELERRLRRLKQSTDPGTRNIKRPIPPERMIRELVAQGIFTEKFGDPLRGVIAICNRAIHGEDIRDVDARKIINAGFEFIEVLDVMIRQHAATRPLETTVITPEERDKLAAAMYLLTTVVPLVEKPERRLYRLTQEELDDFIDDYSEFAEFIIGLEPASPPAG